MMNEYYFGLPLPPFKDRADTQSYYPTAVCEGALAAQERTVFARDLELAMTGEGGRAPWLNVSGAAMASDPFDASITPTDIMRNEETEEAWSAADRTSGASIVDGEYEGFNGESFGSGPNNGTFLLARLERATARAERMTSTTEATLIRLAAVEKHLAAAREDCQAVAQRLDATIVSAERIHDGLLGLVAHADEKVDRLASHHAAAGQVLNRLCAANVTGHQVVEHIEEFSRVAEESVPFTHPAEVARRLSREPEPFARISAEAAGEQLQVLSEPHFDATPVEPKVTKSPTRSEDIARLIEEAMRQEVPAPL